MIPRPVPISKETGTLKMALFQLNEVSVLIVDAPAERLRYAKVEAKP
jgi:hypothetical protein